MDNNNNVARFLFEFNLTEVRTPIVKHTRRTRNYRANYAIFLFVSPRRAFQLTELLIVTCCSIIAARSETSDTDQELLKRASEQLERLAPYRRSADQEAIDLANLLEAWRPPVNQDDLNGGKTDTDQGVPWQQLEIVSEQTEPEESAKRADDKKQITIDIITDPKYAVMMQERIKRGFNAGSASLITSIAGGVLSGVASASSGSAAKASSSSSQHDYGQPAYGPAPAAYSVM